MNPDAMIDFLRFRDTVIKKDKLLVPVNCTKRRIYLFRPKGELNYSVKFTPPRVINGARMRWAIKRVVRTTGSNQVPAAKRTAAAIIERFWRGDDAGQLKLRGDYASIGKLIEIYEARAQERQITIRGNTRSLRLVLRVARGGDPDSRSTAELTPELVRDFERLRLRGVTDPAALRRVRSSTASFLRQARSIVAKRKMKFYERIKLPDLTTFREESVQAPKRSMPRPPDMNALAVMDAAAPQLAEADPAVYVAHLMFSRFGLRNIEILNARTHWIEDGDTLAIIDRPEENFFPKGCEGRINVSAEVLAEILRFQHLCVDGYLIPGQNATERHDAIYRRHSRWVSTWIKDQKKTSYELRRYAGSRLLDMGANILQVRDFLRHRDVQTTQQWYLYRLNQKLPTIGLRELMPKVA